MVDGRVDDVGSSTINDEASEDTTPDTFRMSRQELEKSLANVTGIETLREFDKHLPEVTVEEFCAQFQHPFLIQRTRSTTLTPGSPGFFTLRTSDLGVEQDWLSSAVIPLVHRDDAILRHSITVGRTDNNDVVLPRAFISKFHASFRQDGERWTLTDSGSLNGTKIDEQRLEVQRPYPIGTGDPILFANQLRFLFLEPQDLFMLLNRRQTR